MPAPYATLPGRRHPFGATVEDEGVNFSVYSRHATGAELLLYEDAWALEPFQVITLDPEPNHTFFAWHVLVVDLPPGTHYTWRMQGPYEPREHGWRFDPEVELIDPWARAVNNCKWDRWERQPRRGEARTTPCAPWSWRTTTIGSGDEPLAIPSERMVVYELHVGGFTRHPSAGVAHPGTFAALVEKIPYLKDLGITHVELMPVMAFDEQDVPEQVWEAGLTNFWGYSTHSFFSPHPGYCIHPREGRHRTEFRDMVRALHRAGIGVILDVVFNHTAEGGFGGPVLNFKGFANETFYCLDALDKTRHLDFTGCGNTVNANHPMVTRFIVDCLEYWVREMHVDGFRFDLASAMARDEMGLPMHNPPVLWAIELSDVLARTKIIAEAWDAAGLYQVGSFPGYRWAEWNGRYRDSVRRFVRGDPGLVAEMATRLSGSSDLYQRNLRHPINSINFVTCHDGFTLNDLVSYDRKHNRANREGNRDGCSDNLSWNCGVEGETDRPEVLRPAPPPGAQLPRRALPQPGHPHAARRGRGPARPGRQQQCLVPGQSPGLVRLDPGGAQRRCPALRPRADRPAQAPPQPAAPALPLRAGARGLVHPGHRLARGGPGRPPVARQGLPGPGLHAGPAGAG